MNPKLDDFFQKLLLCPFCKAPLSFTDSESACGLCGNRFPHSDAEVWNFMPDYPDFLQPKQFKLWSSGQEAYESWDIKEIDDYDAYLAEIDSVQEIYTTEFLLQGTVLDVGGHQGRLRHFLPLNTAFLSIDPYANVFNGLEQKTNLLRAYPCLREPCNFLQAQAEYLPLQAESFDYVHMRSVLDHFMDPYLALCEARRILRMGGGLLIGIHVVGGSSAIAARSGLSAIVSRVRKKVRDEGLKDTASAVAKRVTGQGERDAHIWHPTYPELLELLKHTHFEIEKLHWQKPPFDHVLYLMARKL